MVNFLFGNDFSTPFSDVKSGISMDDLNFINLRAGEEAIGPRMHKSFGRY